MTTHRVHHGHNIKRLREIQGVKQQTLALALGTGWNQKKVSLLESKSIIDEALLEQVARALGVSIAAIDGFTEASIVQLVTGARLPEPAGPLRGCLS